MVRTDWDTFTADYSAQDLARISDFRHEALKLEDVEERISMTVVSYAVTRIFASAYVKHHWLEISIDLLREVAHPLLRASFHTTAKVVTHRFTLGVDDHLDHDLLEFLEEARSTVGPGTR